MKKLKNILNTIVFFLIMVLPFACTGCGIYCIVTKDYENAITSFIEAGIFFFFIAVGLVNGRVDAEEEVANRIKTIDIKYFDNEIDKLKDIDKGDWIDLRASETVELKAGEFKLIPLGVGMKLPEGYEAHIVPRSSTFKNWGILQTNSMAVIDNSYSGDSDLWRYPVYATRDVTINKNERICQFRIVENQPKIIFNQVDHLDDVNRGGFGSTGKA